MPASQATPEPQADVNWQRYTYAKQRGHRIYVAQCIRNEGMYLGGGLQWLEADVQKLRDTGNRPAYELNEILGRVNAAVGYQIHNRMDISFLPRGGMADMALATIRSKVAMQICDQNKFHWKETQVFSDGLIEQRGYFDVRMCFDKNVFGDVEIATLDPRDVVPDPDAKSYDPREWFDVTVTRWYSLDDIESYYGKEARAKVQQFIDSEGDFGEMDDDGNRNKFGDDGPSTHLWDSFLDDPGVRKYRIIDRQRWQYQMSKVAVYPTGDVKPVDDSTPEQLAEYVAQGAVISKRMQRKVRWTVTTRWATLHDDISPYDRFTVIPYFCFFRRGRTRGLVDNAIGPQEALNKAMSQFIHIVNTTANSGWTVEENSLVNMETEELEDQGAKTGLVIIFKQGTQRPEKILPNPVPTGMEKIIDIAARTLKSVTVPDAMMGKDEQDTSGLMSQTRQYAAQQQLAIPLDNLARTRYMVADFVNVLISTYYDNNRLFRIAETDPKTGKQDTVDYHVNVFDATTRTWSNDLTIGDYDVVISEQPMMVTFENSQYEQAIRMREAGIKVPDNVVIKHSNLSDKAEILEQMSNEPPLSPLDTAKANLATAQAAYVQAQARAKDAEAANVRVTTLFGAAQTGQLIAQLPAIAVPADAIARSAGFEDQDAPPAIPAVAAPLALPAPAGAASVAGVPQSTNPLAPASPDVGARPGIRGGGQ